MSVTDRSEAGFLSVRLSVLAGARDFGGNLNRRIAETKTCVFDSTTRDRKVLFRRKNSVQTENLVSYCGESCVCLFVFVMLFVCFFILYVVNRLNRPENVPGGKKCRKTVTTLLHRSCLP